MTTLDSGHLSGGQVSEGIGLGTLPLRYPRIAKNGRHTFAYKRLTEVFETAKIVPFDDSSRIVFFSDCHRGDNGQADAFTRNKALFLHALTHYYHEGFTYVEVGDGDELWKNRRFGDIRRAHNCIFDLMHKLDQQNRLHLILGNHDIQGSRYDPVKKDGILAQEGLILRHAKTGQQIFVVHGHQADFMSDRLYVVSRFLVRFIWKPLQLLGLVSTMSWSHSTRKRKRIEQRIIGWVQARRQIVICGHTHHPICSGHLSGGHLYGAPPYFNTGSCVYPGYITGLELQNGEIMLVKWTAQPDTRAREALHIKRELIAPPTKLRLFSYSAPSKLN